MKYQEKMNVYNRVPAWFIASFSSIAIAFYGFWLGETTLEYVLFGLLAVVILGIQFYLSKVDFTLEHDEEALVFGTRKKERIPFQAIQSITIQNIDYMGLFGGVGKRKIGQKHGYIFNDSGNCLCIELENKVMYLSIDKKEYWKDWLTNHKVLRLRVFE